MRNIRIYNESFDRFKIIREKRPQDDNNAQTFEHILKFYEEKQITEKNVLNALKEKQLAPTKNNTFQIVKSDK